MIRRLVLLLLVAAGLAIVATPADAASKYVKDGCTFNGTGAASGCAASGGAAGAWNSIANANTGWAAVCAAGDVLFIQARDDGTESIASGNNGDARWQGGLTVPCSGTVGNLTTVTWFPGDTAQIANGPVGCSTTTCDNSTISADGKSYVRIGSTDGLYNTAGRLVVRGAVILHGTGAQTGHVVSGLEITQGWEDPNDGNWAGIRVEDITAPWLHHNYIHDIIMTSGGINASSGSGIKIYRSPGAITEYNRILRACDTEFCGPNGTFESQGGGVDDKDGSVNNRTRYNFITSVPVCLRFQNQGVTATGTQAYGNVCERGSVHANLADHAAIVTEAGDITDLLLDHNTITGWGLGTVFKGAINGSGGLTFSNSIIANVSGGDPADRNFHDDGSAFALADFAAATDYNAFDSDADYQVDGTSTTIALWRTASSRDAHSHEESTVCGGFASGTDTNYHITSGACLTGSSTGGEQGAYGASGATNCVGHLCGAGGAAAPTVTSVTANSGTTSGGTSVTITGTGFVATPGSVTFGGSSATSVVFVSSTSLTCTTPAHAAGAVDVVVTNPDTQTGTGTGVFTYVTPGSSGVIGGIRTIPPTIRRPD